MKRIEYLAGLLDVEVSDFEKQATQKIFTESRDFWMLCLECRIVLNEEKNGKDNRPGNSQLANRSTK